MAIKTKTHWPAAEGFCECGSETSMGIDEYGRWREFCKASARWFVSRNISVLNESQQTL